jgi:5-methylcytosine-specific restriction endonuclease McrA
MTSGKKGPESGDRDRILTEALRNREKLEQTYRARALKLFPPVCGRCGREFSGIRLRELTVHHRDHNHDNNPPDGSNWELLCRYCHDNEHSRYEDAEYHTENIIEADQGPGLTHRPFANLADLLKGKKRN